jgi:hypothetical protein
VSHPILTGVHGQDENGEEIVIDSSGSFAELAERKKGGVVQGSRLDDSGHGGETPYLIQSRLWRLEIVRLTQPWLCKTRSLSARLKRALGRFARQIAIPKTVKRFPPCLWVFLWKLRSREAG